MEKYRIAKRPKLTAKRNVDSWGKIEKYLDKHGSGTIDELAKLCSKHDHPGGGEGFVRYCIKSGWLKKAKSWITVDELSRKTRDVFKEGRDVANPYVKKAAATSKKMLRKTSPSVQKAADSMLATFHKANISRSTKLGGLFGGITGLLLAGTGGMGIAAFGGAVGVPVAIVTAVVGAGIGSRVGAEKERHELVRLLEENAQKRDGESIEAVGQGIEIERIQGKADHFKALDDAIADAKETLCIRSGWIASYVVTQEFADKFKDALNRGVSIYIESGWRKSGQSRQPDNASSLRAKEVLKSLVTESHFMREGKEYSMGKLFVGDVPTHIKEVVVDGRYYLSGSNNWLSNASHTNKEASHVIHNPVLAREIRDETITSVLTNPSEDVHGANLEDIEHIPF